MKKPLVLLSMITGISLSATADDSHHSDALTIDRTVIANTQIQFPNEKRIYPKISDFEVINYVLMSSHEGERWATVTLRNNADGRRQFNSAQIMALFANGERSKPYGKKQMFDDQEILTLSLNFGKSKFPLLEVYTRSE